MSLKPDNYTAAFAIMMLYIQFQGLMCQLPSKCFTVKSSGNSLSAVVFLLFQICITIISQAAVASYTNRANEVIIHLFFSIGRLR